MALILTEARADRLGAYLDSEITLAERGRQPRIELLRSFIRRYEAKTVRKNFPFRGCSSIHVPLVATFVDSIKARITNAIKAQPDAFIDAMPLTEEPISPDLFDPTSGRTFTWRDVAELFEEYMLFEISPAGQVNFVDAMDQQLDDTLMLGTGWMVPIWATRREWRFPEDGGGPASVQTIDNARFLTPSFESVIYPAHYDSVERIPWWGRKYLARPSEILGRVGPNGFNAAKVREFLAQYAGASVAKLADLDIERMMAEGAMDHSYYRNDEIEMCETWCRFDLDGNGKEVPILVDHPADMPSLVLNVKPWPYQHGRIPASVARYIRRRGRMEGMGIPERLESLDEGLSTAVNQMIDNASIANTRLWAAEPDSDAMEALTEIWPNKVIPVGSPNEFKPIQAGEVYPSAFENINILRDFAERVGKVSDYNLGRESMAMGRQSTATGTLALLQEGGQYHDNTSRMFRDSLNDSLQMWRDMIVQQKPIERIRQVLGSRGEILIAAISVMTPGEFSKRIGVAISFSSTAATRELSRQEEQAKLMVMEKFYQGLLSLATIRFGNPMAQQPPASPPVAALIDAVARDSTLRHRKLLESYGERSSASLLPDWDKVLNAAAAQASNGAGNQIGVGGPGGVAGASGMATPPGSPPGPTGGPPA